MIGSTLTLRWDPVVAMETESKVTGYLVGPSSSQSFDLSTDLYFPLVDFSSFHTLVLGGGEKTSVQWH